MRLPFPARLFSATCRFSPSKRERFGLPAPRRSLCRLRGGLAGALYLSAVLIGFSAASVQEPKPGELLTREELAAQFAHPGATARPWVFWYWYEGNVSKEGIRHDLESMAQAGFSGAYVVGIKGAQDKPQLQKPIVQLSPEWWDTIRFAFAEADRLGLKLGIFGGDGFATAGGPWIKPEQSMQRLSSSELLVDSDGTEPLRVTLPAAPANEGYSAEVALLAFPAPAAMHQLGALQPTAIMSGTGANDLGFLVHPDRKQALRAEGETWVQYDFAQPVMVRSLRLTPQGFNGRSLHGRLEASLDGQHFQLVCRLNAVRHGWLDWDFSHSYSIPATSATHFRVVFDLEGYEPGAEDLDTAKWKPTLKLAGLELFERPMVNAWEGKTGLAWRRQDSLVETDTVGLLDSIRPESVLDLTGLLSKDGQVVASLPKGRWVLLRITHTSTGHRNETAGGGKGLECDKLNAEAVRYQYSQWYAQFPKQLGADLTRRVLTVFHTDSWECGSQNWTEGLEHSLRSPDGSPAFSYLPALVGWPVGDSARTEAYLLSFRGVVAERLNSQFFGTLHELTQAQGVQYTAECTAPVMSADGLRHFSEVDVPMGEFWLRSPSHDKPTDVLDAVSGGHIYGKPLIQAEAFTELRIAWDETPAMLKRLGDLQFAHGVNRFVFHVMVQNPWPERSPSVTLGGVGLHLGSNQPWWSLSKAYFDYISRCEALLQCGQPVVDIAVFSGENLPVRSLTPAKLRSALPGLLGTDFVEAELRRLGPAGRVMQEMPQGVSTVKGTEASNLPVQALAGYNYDTVTPDALRAAKAVNGRVQLRSGASYAVLVVPSAHGARALAPFSKETQAVFSELGNNGCRILFEDTEEARQWQPPHLRGLSGVVGGPWTETSLRSILVQPDLELVDASGAPVREIAWSHRRLNHADLYFLSNQADYAITVTASLRGMHASVERWDALTGLRHDLPLASAKSGEERQQVQCVMESGESLFLVCSDKDGSAQPLEGPPHSFAVPLETRAWSLIGDPARGGPAAALILSTLSDLSNAAQDSLRDNGGLLNYSSSFDVASVPRDASIWLDLGDVRGVVQVILNGHDLGILWAPPYRVATGGFLYPGSNTLQLRYAGAWTNRLVSQLSLPAAQRSVWTYPEWRVLPKERIPAGVLGPLRLLSTKPLTQ